MAYRTPRAATSGGAVALHPTPHGGRRESTPLLPRAYAPAHQRSHGSTGEPDPTGHGHSGQWHRLPRARRRPGRDGSGQAIDGATVVIRNGLIQDVGRNVQAPAGARVWDMTGLTVYPGFIDAHADSRNGRCPRGRRRRTHPLESAGPRLVQHDPRTSRTMRIAGVRRSAPRASGPRWSCPSRGSSVAHGVRGEPRAMPGCARSGCSVPTWPSPIGFQRSFELGGRISELGDGDADRADEVRPSWTPTGTIRAWDAYEEQRPRLPAAGDECGSRAALEDAVHGNVSRSYFETGSEEEYLRARASWRPSSAWTPWFRGKRAGVSDPGRAVRARPDPLIVPLNFPDAPEVDDPESALERRAWPSCAHWYLAPTNPGPARRRRGRRSRSRATV